MTNPIGLAMVGLIKGYRLFISPWLGCNCRYLPSCSTYALEAIQSHGVIRGSGLAAGRLLRCHPWGGSGYDPVPLARRRTDRFEGVEKVGL
jgi:putative membrane protein insertion efficiency factor